MRAAEEVRVLYQAAMGGKSTDRSHVIPGNPCMAAYARDAANRLVQCVDIGTDRTYPAGRSA